MKGGLTFDTKDLKRFEKALDGLGGVPQKTVNRTVNKGTTLVRRAILSEVPVDTGALKRGIIRHRETRKIPGKAFNDLMFDPDKNAVFQKPIKHPGEAGGKSEKGYYPASMEYGFLTRRKGGGYKYEGRHFMRDQTESSREQFNQVVTKDLMEKVEKEWMKKHAT